MFVARLPEGRPMMFWLHTVTRSESHATTAQRVVLYKSDELLECTTGITC